MRREPFDKEYSQYYDLLYSDKDYQKEVRYTVNILNEFQPAAKSLLEYGCGTGGHGLLLTKLGYSVTGIELSHPMAQLARAKGLNVHIGDMAALQLDATFDACISIFHVVSYITSNEDLHQFFGNTRSHLRSGGLFVFDVWYTPAVNHLKPETRVKRLENNEAVVIRTARPRIGDQQNIVEIEFEIQITNKDTRDDVTFNETHRLRHFSIAEIEEFARQSGFKILRAEEFCTGITPSQNTWGVNFILRVI